MSKIKFLTLTYPDNQGPWYDFTFTEASTRQTAASQGRTIPGNATFEYKRNKDGWETIVWEHLDMPE